jgi:hypothetical protein
VASWLLAVLKAGSVCYQMSPPTQKYESVSLYEPVRRA